MPENPYLKWYQSPLMSGAGLQAQEEELDQPSLEESPWQARLRGFGAGALQGLQNVNEYVTPENLVATGLGIAAPGIGSAIRAARAARAAPRAIQGLQEALPSLGERMAEFAPQGGEALYNVGRPTAQAVDPVAQAYARILARGGR